MTEEQQLRLRIAVLSNDVVRMTRQLGNCQNMLEQLEGEDDTISDGRIELGTACSMVPAGRNDCLVETEDDFDEDCFNYLD